MRNRSGLVTKLLIAFVMICIFFMILNVQMEINELEKQKNELEERVEELSDRNDELEYEIKRPIDDELIMEIARERLGYYMLGDTVFYYNDGE